MEFNKDNIVIHGPFLPPDRDGKVFVVVYSNDSKERWLEKEVFISRIEELRKGILTVDSQRNYYNEKLDIVIGELQKLVEAA